MLVGTYGYRTGVSTLTVGNTNFMKKIITTNKSVYWSSVADADHFGKPDPDPHEGEKPDPDLQH